MTNAMAPTPSASIERLLARVLNVLAAALVMAALGALAVLWFAWLASSDDPYSREAPEGIAVWLVVVPALAAALPLMTAALFIGPPAQQGDADA